MYNLIPHFIHDKYQAGEMHGQLEAATLFMDIAGFTAMTQRLLQHGKRGAEELAQLINDVFEPVIGAIYVHGGFVTVFAGDALTVLFPGCDERSALAACEAAAAVRDIFLVRGSHQTGFGTVELAVKQGLSAGWVEWGIIGPADHKTYYFRGQAIDTCARAEQQADAGEIYLADPIQAFIPAAMRERVRGEGGYARLKPFHTKPMSSKHRLEPPTLDPEICARFFSPQLWHYAGQGEFRQVSTLFFAFESDLSRPQLDELITHVIQESDHFGGHFVEVDFGDKGGLALICFGAPRTHENDKERALGFLLSLVLRLRVLQFRWRAGVTFGLVYAGMVGTPHRGKFATLGSVVNFAARLMSHASWGQILLSSTMAQQAGFKLAYIGDFVYKGMDEPVPVYRLLGREAGEFLPRSPGEQPMVGRETEMQKVLAFSRPLSVRRPAGAVTINGDAGMGKSLLVSKLHAQLSGVASWFVCQTDEILRRPFNPFVYGLKRYFGQSAEASEAENKARFTRRWQRLIGQLQAHQAPPNLAQELERTQSFIGALLDLHWPDSLYAQLDGGLRFENTIAALKSWLFAESSLRPVALILEDAHWLDEASQILLESLSREMKMYPLLLIMTSRYADNGRGHDFRLAPALPLLTIDLKTLLPSALRQQAEQILAGPIDEGLVSLLNEKSQGNPFFAQQFLYYFQENNLLAKDEKGTWVMLAHQLSVPTNINVILIARIDRLAQPVKRVVQAASVLGREFDVEILALMLKTNIRWEVQEAETGQIWVSFTASLYIFKHVLLREAAYDMQLRRQLLHLHLRAAAVYERVHASDLSPHYAVLAYHYHQAQDMPRAQQYSRLAGEQASARGNQQEAVKYLNQALGLAPEPERFDLLLLREGVYYLMGDRQSQVEDLKSLAEGVGLEGEAKTGQVLERQAEVWLRQARYWSATSDYSAAIAAAQKALAVSQLAGQAGQQIRSRYWWGEALGRQGKFGQARKQLEQALGLTHLVDQPDTAARILKEVGWIAFREGKAGEATQLLEEALHLVQTSGNRREEVMVCKALGGAANAGGNYALALTWQHQGLAIAHEIGFRTEEGSLLNNLGNTSRFLGEYERAVEFHRQGAALMQKTGWRMGEAIAQINLGLALPYTGQTELAQDHARAGLELARAIQARMIEAVALYVLGNIFAKRRHWSAAEITYQKAVELFRILNLPHYVTEAVAGLIRVYLALPAVSRVKPFLTEVMAYLDAGGSVNSVEEPLRVYWTCYQALTVLNDRRAPAMLQQAHTLLQKQVSILPEASMRRSFLENIPYHRAIVDAWRAEKTT